MTCAQQKMVFETSKSNSYPDLDNRRGGEIQRVHVEDITTLSRLCHDLKYILNCSFDHSHPIGVILTKICLSIL